MYFGINIAVGSKETPKLIIQFHCCSLYVARGFAIHIWNLTSRLPHLTGLSKSAFETSQYILFQKMGVWISTAITVIFAWLVYFIRFLTAVFLALEIQLRTFMIFNPHAEAAGQRKCGRQAPVDGWVRIMIHIIMTENRLSRNGHDILGDVTFGGGNESFCNEISYCGFWKSLPEVFVENFCLKPDI